MKKFRDLSINVKMSLIVGFTGLVVMTAVCSILIVSQRSEVYENSTSAIKSSAALAAANLAEYINSTAMLPRSFAHIAADIIQSSEISAEEKRGKLLDDLRYFAATDRRIDNLWAVFKEDAVDGLDAAFAGTSGNNAGGVFMPWFHNRQLRTMQADRANKLFDVVSEHKREVFTDAYLYELSGREEHLFSLCIPIIVDNEIVGVVGRDYLVSHLSDLSKRYDITGQGRLVSSQGVIIVHSDPARIGAIYGDGNREALDGIAKGDDFELIIQFQGREEYNAFVVVQFGECELNWFYTASILTSEIYAALNQVTIYLVILAIIGALFIASIGFVLIRWMLKDVKVLNNTIDKLSLGQINQQIEDSKSRDEIGTMKSKLFQFVGSLKRTASFANNIGQGKLDVDYELLSDGDVLGKSLLEMRTSLQTAESERTVRLREEEQRNWGTEGLAKFAEILRQDNDDMEALSYNVISNIVKYLNANQGGIFILNEAENEDEKILELTACYAYDRKKFVESKVRPGEGLVGASFLEGEPVYMTNVPNDYISITSGLGDANPKAIYICPLKVNDVIYGVMEIASFSQLEPYQREFINKVSESIASTIASVHVNLRTSKLLEQTKLQAEEMKNAEEELRQNMEEMQATQEEMRRHDSANEYQLMKMELLVEAANIGLWDMEVVKGDPVNPNNTFTWSDDFRRMLGYSDKSDFPNVLSSWSEKLHPDDKERTLNAFAEHLTDRSGQTPYDLEYRLKKNDGEYGYFRAFGATIRDEEGYATRVAGAIMDITKEKLTAQEMQATQNKMQQREVELEKVLENNKMQIKKLDVVLEASNIALWENQIIGGDLDNPNNPWIWSNDMRRILGFRDHTDFPNTGASLWDRIHKDDLDRVNKAYEEHISDRSGATPYEVEYRIAKKDGEYIHVSENAATMREFDGTPLIVLGTWKDITHRVKRDEELRRNEAMLDEKVHWYENLLDAYELPISVTDIDKKITFLNKAALTVLGTTRAETLGKYCGDVWGVDICKDERCGIECMKRGIAKSTFKVGDQTFTTSASFIIDAKGDKVGHIEIVNNITQEMQHEEDMRQHIEELQVMQEEMRTTEEALKQQEKELTEQLEEKMFEVGLFQKTIMKANNVVELSVDGFITDINDNILAIWDNEPKSMFVGKHAAQFIGDDVYKAVWKDMQKGTPHESEQTVTIETGKSLVFQHKFMPVRDKKGKLLKVLLLAFLVQKTIG